MQTSINPQTSRRLGKKLYLLLGVIIALITIGVALLVSPGFPAATQPTDASSPEWSQTYYGTSAKAIQTSDGGYLLAASNASLMFPAAERAPILIKTDANGNLQWNRTYPDTGHVAAASAVQTQDGGYALTGTNIAPPITSPVYSGWLIKTDAQGNVVWQKTFGLPLQTCFGIQDHAGDYVVVGYASNEQNGADTVLMKVDGEGDLLWTKTFGGNSSTFYALQLVEADDGGYVLVGSASRAGWVAKTDADGNLQWSHTYTEGESTFPLNSITKAADGGYIFTASNIQNSWLMKTDAEGNQEWVQPLADGALVRSVAQLPDGGYVLVGSQNRQACILRTDASGGILSTTVYGEVSDNRSSFASSVIPTQHGIVVAGTLNQYSPTTVEGFQATPTTEKAVWLTSLPLDENPTRTG
jgi:hypothetical protein